MGLDIRVPIGMLFGILGIMLVIYGFISDQAIYARSMGTNVNLIWGVVMLAFGLVMLFLGRKSLRKTEPGDTRA